MRKEEIGNLFRGGGFVDNNMSCYCYFIFGVLVV